MESFIVNKLRSSLIVVSVLFISLSAFLVANQDPKVKSSDFMKRKLVPAKQILEGIALKDFEMIAKNADQIHKWTLDEGWMVVQTERYMDESSKFQKSMARIIQAAKDEDLDSASFAYMQMTMNCVRCHELLREEK